MILNRNWYREGSFYKGFEMIIGELIILIRSRIIKFTLCEIYRKNNNIDLLANPFLSN